MRLKKILDTQISTVVDGMRSMFTPMGLHFSVTCYKCGRSVRADDAFADLHGPAYKAYYCPECAEALAKCDRTDSSSTEEEESVNEPTESEPCECETSDVFVTREG